MAQTAPPRPASARNSVIVALDFSSGREALDMAARLQGICRWVKVGLELYVAAGNQVVHALQDQGFSVFLDLKLHDIPNTVAGAVRSVAGLGAGLLTVHAAGGPDMLRAAAEAAATAPNPPELLAVTVLTSMDLVQLEAAGISVSPREHALKLAGVAMSSGIRGLVCSAQEVAEMRKAYPEAILVTPGIRPVGAASGDQKRIATPEAALAAGSDYLVVGRPITQAPDPARALQLMLETLSVPAVPVL